MMAANYRHIGGGENRRGRHYSRFSAFCPPAALAGQSLALRKLSNARSNRRNRARIGTCLLGRLTCRGVGVREDDRDRRQRQRNPPPPAPAPRHHGGLGQRARAARPVCTQPRSRTRLPAASLCSPPPRMSHPRLNYARLVPSATTPLSVT